MFVTDDGAVLLYPVPEPHVPVLPLAGPRWPLEWDGVPGSPLRITDAGIPRGIRHSGGYQVPVDTAGGRVTGLRLLGGDRSDVQVRAFGYESGGHLGEVVNSAGQPYRFTYDRAGRITSWTDRNDAAYHYAYDSGGRCVATHGPDGHLDSTLSYDDAARTTVFTDSLGHRRTYTHNTAYRLVAETDPLGHTTTRQWDTENRLTAITDPLGRTTRYAYDGPSHAQPSVITQPDGTSATATYKAWGRPLAVTDPGGGVWRHTYDERGNLASLTDPSGAATVYAYDSAGAPVSVTDPWVWTRRPITMPTFPIRCSGRSARTLLRSRRSGQRRELREAVALPPAGAEIGSASVARTPR
ncbi:hypothetical protein OG702_16770 [Streptomyces sp. NBC_01198]|nr:hypothetical protein OG702_16770 [Streptomyces sp. NBC_01198]